MATQGPECRVCGGPLPERALLVIGSMGSTASNMAPRAFSVTVMDSDGFNHITLQNNGLCGHWCAIQKIGLKMDAFMDGSRAAEAINGKVPV